MNKKLVIVSLFVVFILAGTAMAMAENTTDNTGTNTDCPFAKERNGFGMRGKTPENFEICDFNPENMPNFEAMHRNITEKLGLSEDATSEEIQDARQAQREQRRTQFMEKAKEKLGLAEDATSEEIQEAMQQHREENGGLMKRAQSKVHSKMRGFAGR